MLSSVCLGTVLLENLANRHIDDPTWNASTFDLAAAEATIAQNPFDVVTWKGDLSAFQNAGGKICQSHS
jgi:hypothetical protein